MIFFNLLFNNNLVFVHKLKSLSVLSNRKRGIKSFKSIPGPISLPLIGTLYQYLPILGNYKFDTLHINGFKKYEKFGSIVREEILPGVNIVWLFNPKDIEALFRQEGKYPMRRSHLALEKYRLDRPNVYNSGGLLPTNGPEWFRIRSVFQKGLSSPQAVKTYIDSTDQIVLEWLHMVEILSDEPNIDYLPELSRLFLELTGKSTIDVRFNSFSKLERKKHSRSSKLIKAAFVTNSCILKLDNGPQLWRKFDTPLYKSLKKSQRYMEDVAIDLLSLKMSLFTERQTSTRLTLLENYLASPEVDFKDVIGVVCDFLLAGIDTATYTTAFLLYHIAKNPDVQENLYKESVRLLPKSDSQVTEEILQQAQYTKAVLKESLRLRPVSVGVGRILQNDCQFSGYQVPEGTNVVTQNQVSCRLEEYFLQPEKLIPERWLKGHPLYKQSHPFLLLPFGHGPRSCVARRLSEQNMLIVLLKTVRKYQIGWNGAMLDSRSLLINKPDGPIKLIFSKR